MTRRGILARGMSILAGLFLPRAVLAAELEQRTLSLAVGGKTFLQYAPVVLAEQLGYFKDEGLDLRLIDLQGGSKALEALLGGAVDVVAGSFDHIVQMQAKRQSIYGLVLFSRMPGIVIGVRSDLADKYTGPASFKGMLIGVASPGSQTNFAVSYVMTRAGLAPQDATFFGVGAGPAAIAAIQQKRIEAISNADPVMTKLADAGLIRIVTDSRTQAGSDAAFGGAWPSGTIYAKRNFVEKNPRTIQALVNAVIRALAWIQTATDDQIAAAMPVEFSLGDRALYVESIRNSRGIWSQDGRFSADGARVSLSILSAVDPTVQGAKIDLDDAYTNTFVEQALRSAARSGR